MLVKNVPNRSKVRKYAHMTVRVFKRSEMHPVVVCKTDNCKLLDRNSTTQAARLPYPANNSAKLQQLNISLSLSKTTQICHFIHQI